MNEENKFFKFLVPVSISSSEGLYKKKYNREMRIDDAHSDDVHFYKWSTQNCTKVPKN